MSVLELRSVSASYGPFKALFDVSLFIEPGGAVALLGSNGSGKTTVARVASGLVKPTQGSVWVQGDPYTGRAVYQFAWAGIAHAPEGRSVFATLSVADNLALSFRISRGVVALRRLWTRPTRCFRCWATAAIRSQEHSRAANSECCRWRGVLVERPKLLIADELSLGLAPLVIDGVYENLKSLRATGTALLIVEQHITHALELCDTAVLMRHGTVRWQGSTADAATEIAERGVAG